jgi:hypothetical protein
MYSRNGDIDAPHGDIFLGVGKGKFMAVPVAKQVFI